MPMQAHRQHLFVVTKEQSMDWSPQFENEGFAQLLKRSLKQRKMQSTIVSYVTTGTADKATEDGDNALSSSDVLEKRTVLVMPDMIRYNNVTENDIDLLVEELSIGSGGGVIENDRGSTLQREKMPVNETNIFVCTHGKRDMRCGVCGPQVINDLSNTINQVNSSGVTTDAIRANIRGVTHVGGHKFAANVIIYKVDEKTGKVRGDWYGNVDEPGARLLVEEHIVKGNIVKELWRGSPNNEE